MTELTTDSIQVRPLTKRGPETGKLYWRRSEVELQIEKVLLLKKDEIIELLKERNREAANYLYDETLVYLLRDAWSEGDRSTVETLFDELNRRLPKLLGGFRSKFSEKADFEDFRQKVVTQMIEKIFNVESNAADYAQVNFGDFIVSLAFNLWRSGLNRIKREQGIFQVERNYEGEKDSPEIEHRSNDLSPEETLILREGIRKLPPHIKEVAVLILDGWQIESKDETMPTISKYLNVSSRTIRNWLKEAREILAGYEGEIR